MQKITPHLWFNKKPKTCSFIVQFSRFKSYERDHAPRHPRARLMSSRLSFQPSPSWPSAQDRSGSKFSEAISFMVLLRYRGGN